jgi:hypothetical protein
MRRPALATTISLLCIALVAAGCGRDSDRTSTPKAIGVKGDSGKAAADLGFPVFATKNTVRVAGADPIADAAAVARAVYPGGSVSGRPPAVALADAKDWRATLVASALMSAPIRAPLLLSRGDKDMPDASQAALALLRPSGSKPAGGAQIVRVGDVPRLAKYRSTDLRGRNPAALARAVDAFVAAASGRTSSQVLVVSADDAKFALPAAAWAAKSGDPILFVNRNSVPADTRAAIRSHQQPKIYVLGPSAVISPKVTRQLRKLGAVTRIGGKTPVANAVDFASYYDGTFGFGAYTAGHHYVLTREDGDPAVAGAVSALSGSGGYASLLLLDDADALPKAVRGLLLDSQPGYRNDPANAVYNRGWIVGDERAISAQLQARIDDLLEIHRERVSRP